MRSVKAAEPLVREPFLRSLSSKIEGDFLPLFFFGCVAQLVEQRSPKSPVGGSNPSALVVREANGECEKANCLAFAGDLNEAAVEPAANRRPGRQREALA